MQRTGSARGPALTNGTRKRESKDCIILTDEHSLDELSMGLSKLSVKTQPASFETLLSSGRCSSLYISDKHGNRIRCVAFDALAVRLTDLVVHQVYMLCGYYHVQEARTGKADPVNLAIEIKVTAQTNFVLHPDAIWPATGGGQLQSRKLQREDWRQLQVCAAGFDAEPSSVCLLPSACMPIFYSV